MPAARRSGVGCGAGLIPPTGRRVAAAATDFQQPFAALPPYSPKLNPIEDLWGQVQDVPAIAGTKVWRSWKQP